MRTREYEQHFRYLMEQCCLFPGDIFFVESIAEWAKTQDIDERDAMRPLKLAAKGDSGCRMVIREEIPEEVMVNRINALRIRSQLKNVAFDRADLLNSDKKRLAYLFFSEFAKSLPDIDDDDLAADDWAFDLMERLGFFRT